MYSHDVTFDNGRGDQLAACIDLPADGRPFAWALFAHCFTGSKDLRVMSDISRALTAERIAVMRFDFTGLGDSEGDFSRTNFTSNVDDIAAASDFLNATYSPPEILIGHSFGGAAVLQAAHRIDSVRAVATIGAPHDPEHVTHLIEEQLDEIEARGEATIRLAGRSFCIRKQFLDDLDAVSMDNRIESLDRALLILHSPTDNIVGVENAAAIFTAAKHPKSFVTLDTADHMLTNRRDSLYAGSVIAAWATKYIDVPVDETKRREDPADNRVVAHTGPSGYRTEVLVDGHSVISDEPREVGGDDTGPTPYGLLVSSLGACTSMTLRMYADRKEWPLEGVTVRLSHSRVHKKDCDDCEEGKAKRLDVIHREVEIIGDLDHDQRERLIEIANRCPVHRTLEGEVEVQTTLTQ